jgi:hypothetical protein
MLVNIVPGSLVVAPCLHTFINTMSRIILRLHAVQIQWCVNLTPRCY